MFQRFTERARRVMGLARREAWRVKSEFIGSEHILLGMLVEGEGIAAKELKNVQISPDRIREEIDRITPSPPAGSVSLGQLPFSPRSGRVFELAAEASEELGHDVIGTEHLLLGLIREDEGKAAHILTSLGVKLDDLRRLVLEVVGADRSGSGIAWSARTRNVAEKALAAASRTGSREVEPEHLLLGILEEGGPAGGLLVRQGVTSESILGLIPPRS